MGVAFCLSGLPARLLLLLWTNTTTASPFRRRRRRRCQAAGESPICRCFLRRRQIGGGCTGCRRRRFKMAAVRVRGVLVEDLAISGEMVWRRPRIWSSSCLGRPPSRCCCFVFRSSSMELVATAVLQSLRARSSSAPKVGAPGGWVLRRLRRRRGGAPGDLEVEEGLSQLCFSCFFSVSFVACISICTLFLAV